MRGRKEKNGGKGGRQHDARGEKERKNKKGAKQSKKKKQERKNAGYFPQATPKNRGS